MARLIQERVKKPLAEELLFGKLANGGHVKVTLAGDGLALDIVPAAQPAVSAGAEGDPALG